MVLASLGEGGYFAVIGGYLLVVLIAFLLWPRDVYGRRRALGCVVGIAIMVGLFVVAFAAWAADAIF